MSYEIQVEIPGLDGVTVAVPIEELIDDYSPYVGGFPFPLDRWGSKELDPELLALVDYWQKRAISAETQLEGMDE